MVHRAAIGDDCRGPVAEATTREQCNALYPGSNPGRASSLRWLRQFRLGKPASRTLARRAAAGFISAGPGSTGTNHFALGKLQPARIAGSGFDYRIHQARKARVKIL